LTVNPAKACQPLGAVFAAVGFEQTIPFVHGSQGCVPITAAICRDTSRSRAPACPRR
jgi:nitrogenase molybdenum-iron protein alpha/beta subunit